MGLAMIGTSHVCPYALAASGTGDAARVLAARDPVAGGVVGWVLLALTGAFLVHEFVPSPLGELPALVAGLAAFSWIALLRVSDGRGGREERSSLSGPRPWPVTSLAWHELALAIRGSGG